MGLIDLFRQKKTPCVVVANKSDLGNTRAALAEAAAQPGADAELEPVVTALGPLYGAGRTVAQRTQLASAPRTKVAALMAAVARRAASAQTDRFNRETAE